jgi:hypothetical protein
LEIGSVPIQRITGTNDARSLAANATLLSSDSMITVTAGTTYTLPFANALGSGKSQTLTVENRSANHISLQRQGSTDLIIHSNLTSGVSTIPLLVGEKVTLVSHGSNNMWVTGESIKHVLPVPVSGSADVLSVVRSNGQRLRISGGCKGDNRPFIVGGASGSFIQGVIHKMFHSNGVVQTPLTTAISGTTATATLFQENNETNVDITFTWLNGVISFSGVVMDNRNGAYNVYNIGGTITGNTLIVNRWYSASNFMQYQFI